MITYGSQDVSDTSALLLHTNLIWSYGHQKVCELNYHVLAR